MNEMGRKEESNKQGREIRYVEKINSISKEDELGRQRI